MSQRRRDAGWLQREALTLLLLCACGHYADPTGNVGFLSVTVSATSEPADGSQVVVVRALIDTSARFQNTAVTFNTTLGTFLGGSSASSLTVTPNDSGIARAELRAPSDTGTAYVTISTANVARTIPIAFTIAPATRIAVSPPATIPVAGQGVSIPITATLTRLSGTPSSGGIVSFTANRAAPGGTTPGRFVVDSVPVVNGMATDNFVLASADSATIVFHAKSERVGVPLDDSVVVHVYAKSP